MTAASRSLIALSAVALLASCQWGPEAFPDVLDAPPGIEVSDLQTVSLDTVLATDILPLAGGRFAVLDGKRQRVFLGGPDQDVRVAQGDRAWGEPLRAIPTEGGYIVIDPGADERLAAMTWVDLDWQLIELLAPDPEGTLEPPLSPTCAVDLGEQLVVGDRYGRIVWLNRVDGAIVRVVDEDREGDKIGSIADLVAMPGTDGGLVAVDSLGPYLHFLDADGTAHERFGRYGLWAGTFKKPKSVTVTADGDLLVADSALGALQVFTPTGKLVGLLTRGGEPLRMDHPISVRRAPAQPDLYYALDATTGTLLSFRLPASEIAQARALLGSRFLRMPLVESANDTVGDGGHNCLQCHDGFLTGVWRGWDPDLESHPVDLIPEKEVPAFFPLRDGELACDTCHSPHGIVTLDRAIGVEHAEDRLDLLREHPADTFTRLAVANSEICVACHGQAAHQAQVDRSDAPKAGAHPTGADLIAALDKVMADDDARDAGTDCLSCHTPHGGTTAPLLRSLDDGGLCAACHERQSVPKTNHPLGQRPGDDVPRPDINAKLTLARGGGVLCRTCHQLVGGKGDALLREPADGTMLCLSCHDDRKAAPTSRHGRIRGSQGFPCLGCHDVHGGHQDSEMLRTRRNASEGDPNGCLTCHGPGGKQYSASVRPGERGHPVPARATGIDPIEACETCHDPHLADVPKVGVCGECHAAQKIEEARGGHGRADCIDCHPAHRNAPSARNVKANPVAQRCLGCHAAGADSGSDTPRVSSYEHPAPVFGPDGERWKPLGKLPLFAPDGQLVPAGTNGDLTCATCHRVHGPDPAEDLTGLRRPEWREPCGACHGSEAMPFYLYFHEPDRR